MVVQEAFLHRGDATGEPAGFRVVMCNVNHGEIARAVERCEFGAQAAGGVAIERAEGLIEDQDHRVR